MSVAGPSVIRHLHPIVSPTFSRLGATSLHPLHHLPPALPHQARLVRFSTIRPLLSDSKRQAHALAQPSVEPLGFAGVPPPAFLGGTDEAKAKQAPRRTIKAKKNAITMTPSALDRLRALLASSDDPKLLRIGVKTRGCAGMAYHLEYVPPPGGRFDEVVEQDGVKVLIDSKALFSIIGSVMDWRESRLSAGFVFDNPNVVDTCGCGESFNIQ